MAASVKAAAINVVVQGKEKALATVRVGLLKQETSLVVDGAIIRREGNFTSLAHKA